MGGNDAERPLQREKKRHRKRRAHKGAPTQGPCSCQWETHAMEGAPKRVPVPVNGRHTQWRGPDRQAPTFRSPFFPFSVHHVNSDNPVTRVFFFSKCRVASNSSFLATTIGVCVCVRTVRLCVCVCVCLCVCLCVCCWEGDTKGACHCTLLRVARMRRKHACTYTYTYIYRQETNKVCVVDHPERERERDGDPEPRACGECAP